ncbi:MAG TPA: NUDIX domain-containing protein [Candidatus Saccharibacteria bacterium]|jgi:ADP-ribose pyrophosphatase YjhB (NUDIX family)|nr:NUDIX domain-containing protein [Candidatus Saccharibacteria bacterium]
MNWEYCPYCGGNLRKEVDKSICESCSKHHYENPKSSVGVFLFDEEGRLVLAVRGLEPHRGKWAAVGGFVAIGESLEEAALREVKEETECNLGVDTTQLEYLASVYIEVAFMGYVTPVEVTIFGAKILSDHLEPHDDVSGFVRLTEDECDSKKIAWSKEMVPLVHSAFKWFKQNL